MPRATRAAWRRGLAALWVCTAAVSAAEAVSLSVAEGVPCVSEAGLRAGLEAAGLKVESAGELDVDVSATEGAVRLRARRRRDSKLLVRSVPSRGSCEGLELAAVTLIREWARGPALLLPGERTEPTPATTPLSPATPGRAEPFTASSEPREPTQRLAAQSAAKTARARASPGPVPEASGAQVASAPPPEPAPEAPAATAPAPGAAAPAPSTPGTAAEVALPAAAPASAPSPVTDAAPEEPVALDVRLALGGGVSSLFTSPAVPAGALVLDVGRAWFGVTLDGSLDGTTALTAGGGTVTVAPQTLALSARWRLARELFSLDLGLGARGFRLTATPSGFSVNVPAVLLSVGPAAFAAVWLRVIGPLWLMARGCVAVRFPAEDLVVTQGPTFHVGSWYAAALVGLALAWP